tara:strand:- start:6988 stop:7314 length:327 start_codon:yes stop_codon:yes gene_type:complete
MRKLDKNSKWWTGLEDEWACQDKNGEWWLFKNKKEKRENKMSNLPAKNILAMGEGVKKLLISVTVAMLLGMSLGLNIVQYLKVKSLENVIFQKTHIKGSYLVDSDKLA